MNNLLVSPYTSYDFDDVHIITDRMGVVSSRNDVKFDNNRIIVAPMSAIQNSGFNKECVKHSLSLPVHRFCSVEEQRILMKEAIETKKMYDSTSLLWLSVGLKDWKERFNANKEFLDICPFEMMLDVANCYTKDCIEEIKKIKQYTSLNVSSGNVHTGLAFYDMIEQSGANMLRAGIGNGAACLTSDHTGVGRGQLTLVLDMHKIHFNSEGRIISDGGIRKPGDAAKAFGAGADYIMIGGMFKDAVESQAWQSGVFYGGASSIAKGMVGNDNRYIEGKALTVNKDLVASSVQNIVNSLADGVRSSISYCGYESLEEFIGNAQFEVKHK